ncbi:hypothetical protein I7I53_05664 [Histoplasma capsulatum var. duboisii H88]|uniref:Secreted protein n=1 Tax=Ajellomyces capsulatus (strain H88) TaxID=544711 RepID=A0A8A1LYJ9_AJEC8|nr:hypothetical protein I7I53_05664 [Histoplasma capsulatum var. duboisii H88]
MAMNSSNPPAPSLSACMHLIMLLCMSGSPTTTHEWRNARSPCKNKKKEKSVPAPTRTNPSRETNAAKAIIFLFLGDSGPEACPEIELRKIQDTHSEPHSGQSMGGGGAQRAERNQR